MRYLGRLLNGNDDYVPLANDLLAISLLVSCHRRAAKDMPKPNIALTGVFLALHISGGIIGLPIAAVTIVASKQVSRHPTLINFCITWIISSLIYTLLYVDSLVRRRIY